MWPNSTIEHEAGFLFYQCAKELEAALKEIVSIACKKIMLKTKAMLLANPSILQTIALALIVIIALSWLFSMIKYFMQEKRSRFVQT